MTGTSLEVLSFMSSGIKKRTGSEYSDGRPGRINFHSEDEYRTITLLVQSTAYDMQDVAHLRDSINELFDGELMLREMRIKSVEVEYESMGQRTGELQLKSPEYVNGKQIKVTMVSSPEIDDTTLVSTFTVEFETTESPYFETIYTTLELHDSGYSSTAEKYGLVDNIDDEKVKYRFEQDLDVISFDNPNAWETGSINSTTGALVDNNTNIRTKNFISIIPGKKYTIKETMDTPNLRQWWGLEYDSSDNFVGWVSTPFSGPVETTFIARGSKLKLRSAMTDGNTIFPSDVGVLTIPELTSRADVSTFTVYNAGNVTIEPESMMLYIRASLLNSTGNFTIRNKTTSEEIILNRSSTGSHFTINGMVISSGSITNIFRDTNRRFISLAPGDNEFEILNGTFEEIRFDFKYLYR